MTDSEDRGHAELLPAWRRYSGVAIIGVLAVALVATSGSPERPPIQVPDTSVTLVETVPSSTTSPASSPTTSATLGEAVVVLNAAQASLDAWGVFAASGDLSVLETTFDKEGPQYQQLMREAGAIDPFDGTYIVTLVDSTVALSGDSATVSGRVGFGLNEPATEMFFWNIFMVKEDGRWVLSGVEQTGP